MPYENERQYLTTLLNDIKHFFVKLDRMHNQDDNSLTPKKRLIWENVYARVRGIIDLAVLGNSREKLEAYPHFLLENKVLFIQWITQLDMLEHVEKLLPYFEHQLEIISPTEKTVDTLETFIELLRQHQQNDSLEEFWAALEKDRWITTLITSKKDLYHFISSLNLAVYSHSENRILSDVFSILLKPLALWMNTYSESLYVLTHLQRPVDKTTFYSSIKAKLTSQLCTFSELEALLACLPEEVRVICLQDLSGSIYESIDPTLLNRLVQNGELPNEKLQELLGFCSVYGWFHLIYTLYSLHPEPFYQLDEAFKERYFSSVLRMDIQFANNPLSVLSLHASSYLEKGNSRHAIRFLVDLSYATKSLKDRMSTKFFDYIFSLPVSTSRSSGAGAAPTQDSLKSDLGREQLLIKFLALAKDTLDSDDLLRVYSELETVFINNVTSLLGLADWLKVTPGAKKRTFCNNIMPIVLDLDRTLYFPALCLLIKLVPSDTNTKFHQLIKEQLMHCNSFESQELYDTSLFAMLPTEGNLRFDCWRRAFDDLSKEARKTMSMFYLHDLFDTVASSLNPLNQSALYSRISPLIIARMSLCNNGLISDWMKVMFEDKKSEFLEGIASSYLTRVVTSYADLCALLKYLDKNHHHVPTLLNKLIIHMTKSSRLLFVLSQLQSTPDLIRSFCLMIPKGQLIQVMKGSVKQLVASTDSIKTSICQALGVDVVHMIQDFEDLWVLGFSGVSYLAAMSTLWSRLDSIVKNRTEIFPKQLMLLLLGLTPLDAKRLMLPNSIDQNVLLTCCLVTKEDLKTALKTIPTKEQHVFLYHLALIDLHRVLRLCEQFTSEEVSHNSISNYKVIAPYQRLRSFWSNLRQIHLEAQATGLILALMSHDIAELRTALMPLMQTKSRLQRVRTFFSLTPNSAQEIAEELSALHPHWLDKICQGLDIPLGKFYSMRQRIQNQVIEGRPGI